MYPFLLFFGRLTVAKQPTGGYTTYLPKHNFCLYLTQEEENELLLILERYLPDIQMEIANTDSKEFRRELKEREVFMNDLIARLKR